MRHGLQNLTYSDTTSACADPESFVRGGPTLTSFSSVFLIADEGKEDLNTTISGHSSARQQNAIQIAFSWLKIECWLGSFMILQEIRTSIAKKPYLFVIFHVGRASRPPASPLWIRICSNTLLSCVWIS